MNIGAFGIGQQREWSYSYRKVHKAVDNHQTFSTIRTEQKPLVLHYFSDTDEGEKCIGAWVQADTGISTSVYLPADYDSQHPAYHIKIWQPDGSMQEQTIDISDIDLQNADEFEIYTYACHLEHTGQCPGATMRFTGASEAEDIEGQAQDPYQKKNWIDSFKDMMEMQYSAGNISGYLEYKKMYDIMSDKVNADEKEALSSVQNVSEKQQAFIEGITQMPTANVKGFLKDGSIYLIVCDINGLRCKKSRADGRAELVWEIPFRDESEYERVSRRMDELAMFLQMGNEQESETKADIVVKPDGSRVLVVTVNLGGMETTMSVELSKPTNE